MTFAGQEWIGTSAWSTGYGPLPSRYEVCLHQLIGTTCHPQTCRCGMGERCVAVVACRRITAGDELLLDYGDEYWEALEANQSEGADEVSCWADAGDRQPPSSPELDPEEDTQQDSCSDGALV